MSSYAYTNINYSLLAQANEFYYEEGFSQIEVPWIVPETCNKHTKPHDDQSFVLNDGMFTKTPHELVGSAEQGFIHELLKHPERLPVGCKKQSISPCFRVDSYDEFHQPWFIKLELFHYSSNKWDLADMLNMCMKFYRKHAHGDLDIVCIDDTSYDINLNEIEIGSYGFRTIEDKTFIYGTGLALPRFTKARHTV